MRWLLLRPWLWPVAAYVVIAAVRELTEEAIAEYLEKESAKL